MRALSEFQENERTFRAILETTTEWIWIIDRNLRHVYCNPAVFRILGYTPEEFSRIDTLSVIHEQDRETVASLFREAVAAKKGWSGQVFRWRHKDGRYRHLESTAVPVLDGKGELQGFQGADSDITDRVTIEAALRESEERFRSAFENAPIGMALVGLDGSILRVNQALCGILGYTPEQLESMSVPGITHPEDRDREAGDKKRMLQGTSRNYHVEKRYLHADGHVVWGQLSVSLMTDASGKPEYFIGQLEDITDRKAAENALRSAVRKAREEKARSEAVIAAFGDGISIQDTALRVLYQNRIHKEIVGGDFQGRFCYEAYGNRDTVCEGCPVTLSMQDGRVHRVSRIRRTDRGPVHLEVTSSPLRDGEGRIAAGVEVVRDVTERVRMEDELLRTQKLESLGVLAGGIAHDFNNLLTAILGNISLAKMTIPAGEKPFDRLTEAEKASERAQDLTNQLLTFSKGGAPVKETADIPVLVRESASFALRGSKAKCEFQIPEGLWPVDVDRGQIGQVISNLVINADQAMPQGGIIRVECENLPGDPDGTGPEKKGRLVRVSVRDQGIGIPKEYLQRIFDPYFTTKQKGSGLGLATVHAIVQKHGGRVDVESGPGEGAAFHVFLPASENTPPREERTKDVPLRGNGRVLVMDDEGAVRDVMEAMLAELGYETGFAVDGDEAVESYRKAREAGTPFDAAILDLTIPGGTGGIEAARRLRDSDPAARIIAYSGYSNDPAMAHPDRYGFDGVLRKPFQISEIGSVLRKVLPG